MHYSQILLTALPLAGLSLALPQLDPKKEVTQLGIGIPPKGVDCQTDNEPLHTITDKMIQDTMSAAANILQQSAGAGSYGGTYFYFPLPFNVSTSMDTNWPTFNAAAGCDLTDKARKVYFTPQWYPGTTQPELSGTEPSVEYPGQPVTTDIVVFQQVFRGKLVDAKVQYCGLLTNSEYDKRFQNSGQTLFAGTKNQLNKSPSGYRQCNANAGNLRTRDACCIMNA